ncbi:hypothetical protein ACPCG0_02700 [Propionibacteriaceae bacterium Y1923]
MGLFSSKPPLAKEVASELKRRRPQAGTVMAVGHGDGLTLVATTECLALHRPDHDEWEFIGWHLITRGGWNQKASKLRWTLADDTTTFVTLTEPGNIPDVFRDRVRASIVVEQSFPAPGGGHVVISGRRKLAGDQGLVWQVSTLGAARLSDPRVADLAREKAAQLRYDYEV